MQCCYIIRFLVFYISIVLISTASYAEVISSFVYKGNRRISDDTIRAYIELDEGSEFNGRVMDTSVKSLYRTGFFSDINVGIEKGVVTVTVIENPVISKVYFDGNIEIKEDEIQNQISMHKGSIYNISSVKKDLKRIVFLYQKIGIYDVDVKPKIIKLDNTRVNLVYEIKEGVKSRIKYINFAGNRRYSSGVLKGVIASKEERWYKIFSSSDIYNADMVLYDKELLHVFYGNNGFADFEISSVTAELSNNKDYVILTYVINEGIKYSIKGFKVTSKVKGVQVADLNSLINLKIGEIYNYDKLRNISEKMSEHLGAKGYAFIDIQPKINKDKDGKILIDFSIEKSKKMYINNINITNNTKTLDRVIRSQLRILEGDPYNLAKVNRSRQRLQNLGFFSAVKLDIVQNKKYSDRVDIAIDVEETSTGSLQFGGGYHTIDGILGSISMNEQNFLGKGQRVSLNYTHSKRDRSISFSCGEPYFMDKDLAVGMNLYSVVHDREKEMRYKERDNGADLDFTYHLSEHLTHQVGYMVDNKNIYSVLDDASSYIKDQKGKRLSSAIYHSLTYNLLDSDKEPSDGYLVTFYQKLAGLGGDAKFISNSIYSAYYKPLYSDNVIIKLSANAGFIAGTEGKKVYFLDRFFKGGELVRGFDALGLGPRSKTVGKEALGGKKYYSSSLELNFPLGISQDIVKGAAFADCGSLFDIDPTDKNRIDGYYDEKKLRSSYGFGLIFNTPMGKIRLDYAIPFKKKDYDLIQRFNISMGMDF